MFCIKFIFRFIPVFLAVLLVHLKATAQNQFIFFEIIQNDSVALYFNEDFSFTEKDCYDYVRHIRVTAGGDFNGYFEDKSIDEFLLGKGVYYNGLKHGYFEIYYPTGRLFSRGYYENDRPVGIWEYFYQSGLPERTLDITDSVVLLLRHVDETGAVRVQDGSGKFEGLVAGSSNFYGIPAVGRVVNGRADGNWIIPDMNRAAIYSEKFNNGKLVKSSRVSRRKMKNAHVLPVLNTFFLGNYLVALEGFERQSCSETQKYFFNRYPSDLRYFSSDLRQKLNFLIETDLQSDRERYNPAEDNFMTIQFSINERGKPYDIKLLSEWGNRFFETVKNSISKTVFSTNYKTMYFHLKLSYAGNRKYRYTFRFSKRDRVK